MAHFTSDEFDRLERAVDQGRRIALVRQGRELVVIPTRLYLDAGREMIEARHPTTGETITVRLDDVDGFQVVPA